MSKVAYITGASGGIGAAIAEEMAKRGYNLYLNCHKSLYKLDILANRLRQDYSVECYMRGYDITDYDSVVDSFKGIDRLDVLVNNAGIAHYGLLQDMSVEEWRNIINTNTTSCFYTCKNAIPIMLSRKSGRIINITSIWGSVGASMEVAYSASKGALESMTKALAKELAPSNIQVNAIAPGIIDTDMNNIFTREDMEEYLHSIPVGRMGLSEEVAVCVGMLIDAPSYLTGSILKVNGGA